MTTETVTGWPRGTRVETPLGGAWVNVPLPGELIRTGLVYVRLDNDDTAWVHPTTLKKVAR